MKNNSDLTLSNKNRIIANILLILTTLLWGTSFIITKNLTEDMPIFLYLGIRFSVSVVGFLPFLIHFKRISKKLIAFGVLTGLLYYFAIVFQTLGIQTTSAGKAAFITGLGTIMVPFITWFAFKKAPKKRIWLAVLISIVGMGLLLLEGASGIIIGDLLVLACAFLYAVFIVLNDKYVRILDVYLYSLVQLITVSFFSFIGSLFFNENYDLISTGLPFWLIILYMGLIVTSGTFFFQNWSQQHQNPSQTAIIFTLEPVFAVIFASFVFGNETMTIYGWIGCLLVFSAILIAVLKKNNKDNNEVRLTDKQNSHL